MFLLHVEMANLDPEISGSHRGDTALRQVSSSHNLTDDKAFLKQPFEGEEISLKYRADAAVKV